MKVIHKLRWGGVVCLLFMTVLLVTVQSVFGVSPNLLKNSSFENNTILPAPDCWGLIGGGVREASVVNNMFQWWRVDTASSAWHGTSSMRIYRPCDITDPCNILLAGYDLSLVSIWYENVVTSGNSYVFSVYLRSDQPSVNVRIDLEDQAGGWNRNSTFQVGQQWSRYVLPTGALPTLPTPNRFYIWITPQNTGTVWIDAAQFEQGTAATAYQPSQYDLTTQPPLDTSIPLLNATQTPFEYDFGVMSEFNFYMNEPNAKIFVSGGSSSSTRSVRIKLLSADSSSVLEQHDVPYSSKHVFAAFNISSLSNGTYPIVADLIDPVQGQVREKTATLRKLPVKAHSVRVNNVNRMLVVDGNPFVPYTCHYDLTLLSGYTLGNSNAARAFTALAGRYNTITVPINNPPPSGIKSTLSALLDRAAAQGFMVNIWYIPFIKASSYSSAIADMEGIVQAVENKPAMLGWFEVTDEEEVTQTVYDRVKPRVDWLRSRDPYHPISHSDHWPSFDTWKPYGYVGDIIELHSYAWGSPWDTGVASYTNWSINGGQTAKQYGKPFWTMPQSFSCMQHWSRSPSPDELTAAIYAAMTQDSKLFQFYLFESPIESVYDRIGAMKSEVDALIPALASYDDAYWVTKSDLNVLVLTKKVDGLFYIITVNVSPQPKNITLNLSSLNVSSDTVTVLFENRTLPITGGQIQDVYRGYERHVYTLSGCTSDLPGDISGPANVSDCRIDLYDFAALTEDWLKCYGQNPNCN